MTIRTRHYSSRTEKSYVNWIKRYIRFYGTRHPSELNDENTIPVFKKALCPALLRLVILR
ncbi:MAG: phage integrase N-terminal SAM-like domain-containing protein [Candidatus Marinimicrobia bacterium]|nr:phage integrase N-terminal SAM-like domain-containing protein [Candidatus Neomarinimicrobiota bacterium]